MKRLSNAGRAAQTDANLERKRIWLSDLVAKVKDGESLARTKYPTTIKELREHKDVELQLLKVGSPKVLDRRQSPKRLDLINEFDGHLATLATYKSTGRRRVKKPSLTQQNSRLKFKRDDLKYLIGRLLSQIATLLDENRKLRASERGHETSKKAKSDTIKALNQKVVQLGGTLMGGVKRDD